MDIRMTGVIARKRTTGKEDAVICWSSFLQGPIFAAPELTGISESGTKEK